MRKLKEIYSISEISNREYFILEIYEDGMLVSVSLEKYTKTKRDIFNTMTQIWSTTISILSDTAYLTVGDEGYTHLSKGEFRYYIPHPEDLMLELL